MGAVSDILPTGAIAWEQVAILHKENSSKTDLQDKGDIKRHGGKKCVTNSKSLQVRLVLQMTSF